VTKILPKISNGLKKKCCWQACFLVPIGIFLDKVSSAITPYPYLFRMMVAKEGEVILFE
jgi:hypothetical protein